MARLIVKSPYIQCGKQNAVRDKYATLKQEAENHG